jgi:hypothetical protein
VHRLNLLNPTAPIHTLLNDLNLVQVERFLVATEIRLE